MITQATKIISDSMETPVAQERAGIRVLRPSAGKAQTVSDTDDFGIRPSLNVSAVAVIIGCGTKKVHDLCNDGELGFHWVGNKRMFRPEDLESFWTNNRSASKPQKGQRTIDTTSVPSVRSSKHDKGGDKKGSEKGPKKAEVSKAHRLRELSQEMRKW